MYKKVLYLFLVLIFSLLCTACHRPRTAILFNDVPITKDTILNSKTQFKVQKRIYYVFMTEKPLDTEFIRIRILKRDEKAAMTVTNVVYSNDFKLRQDELYYYTDYIVMDEVGYYQLVVYATNSMDKPLSVADFQVID